MRVRSLDAEFRVHGTCPLRVNTSPMVQVTSVPDSKSERIRGDPGHRANDTEAAVAVACVVTCTPSAPTAAATNASVGGDAQCVAYS